MSIESLFSPRQLGALQLPNRIIMAPLTRMRAGANIADPAERHYTQRASAGLIISEGTAVSPDADGYPSDPGIWMPFMHAGEGSSSKSFTMDETRILRCDRMALCPSPLR
jgi:N-ethylmaleimide reductase